MKIPGQRIGVTGILESQPGAGCREAQAGGRDRENCQRRDYEIPLYLKLPPWSW
jgi:hypothetical protein